MSARRTTTLLIAALLAVPAWGIASPATTSISTAASTSSVSSTSPARIHATKGVVTSIDARTLVITRSPRRKHELTFVIGPSTERSGNIKPGATVAVRYRTERGKRVATAVREEPSK